MSSRDVKELARKLNVEARSQLGVSGGCLYIYENKYTAATTPWWVGIHPNYICFENSHGETQKNTMRDGQAFVNYEDIDKLIVALLLAREGVNKNV